MTKTMRKMIKIDEDLCNGCGECVPSCKEGALQIIDGKARLVSDIYCDGLGACLGECPTGALTIEEREAEEFDESAVEKRLEELKPNVKTHDPLPCGCPGSMARTLGPKAAASTSGARQTSELRQWPIQLTLVPVNAPYFQRADLVLMADCTAFSYANSHSDFLKNRAIAIACPKLDDTGPYITKLTQMIQANNFRSIEVVMMEVPCCHGLGAIVERAVQEAGSKLQIKKTILSLEGEVLS